MNGSALMCDYRPHYVLSYRMKINFNDIDVGRITTAWMQKVGRRRKLTS